MKWSKNSRRSVLELVSLSVKEGYGMCTNTVHVEILERGQAWEREEGNPYRKVIRKGKGRMGTGKKETGR